MALLHGLFSLGLFLALQQEYFCQVYDFDGKVNTMGVEEPLISGEHAWSTEGTLTLTKEISACTNPVVEVTAIQPVCKIDLTKCTNNPSDARDNCYCEKDGPHYKIHVKKVAKTPMSGLPLVAKITSSNTLNPVTLGSQPIGKVPSIRDPDLCKEGHPVVRTHGKKEEASANKDEFDDQLIVLAADKARSDAFDNLIVEQSPIDELFTLEPVYLTHSCGGGDDYYDYGEGGDDEGEGEAEPLQPGETGLNSSRIAIYYRSKKGKNDVENWLGDKEHRSWSLGSTTITMINKNQVTTSEEEVLDFGCLGAMPFNVVEFKGVEAMHDNDDFPNFILAPQRASVSTVKCVT